MVGQPDDPYAGSVTTYIDDLYVMQNEHGLIKIGRSVNPEQRRRQLEGLDQCRIEIVTVLFERGRREPAVHRALREYRIEGEWFEGTDAARSAIVRVLRKGDLQWPFPLAEKAGEAWLERLFNLRSIRSDQQEYGRMLRELRHCEPGWAADNRIWSMVWYSRTGTWPMFVVSRQGDEVVQDAYGRDADTPIRVPHYSTQLELAMTLWPEGETPSSWDENAQACCAAALMLVGRGLFSKSRSRR